MTVEATMVAWSNNYDVAFGTPSLSMRLQACTDILNHIRSMFMTRT